LSAFLNALSASFVLMLLMSVGYFMGRAGWMTSQDKKFLGKYIINIAVPCNCINGLLNNFDRAGLAQAGVMLSAAFLGMGCTLLLGAALAALLRLPRERWGVFTAMAGLSNTIFIGLPVCTQLFGEACVPHLMVYYLGNTTLLQSVGLMLCEWSGRREETRFSLGGFCKNLFSKPPIVTILCTLLLLLLGLRPPEPVMKFAGYISNSLSPMALVYCGFIIYELGLKNIRLAKGLPTMLAVRLCVAPVVCLLLCRLMGVEGLARNVFVVMSGLPVVTQVTVMAGAYGADEKYAASGFCLSTLGSFITIPILMVLLGG